MIFIKLLLVFLCFGKVELELHAFFVRADKKHVYLQHDDKTQFVVDRKYLSKQEQKMIFTSNGSEFHLRIPPKALLKRQKVKASKRMMRNIAKHKLKKRRKAIQQGK